MKRTIAMVQARMGSSRLPGKVLAPIGDQTMLDHVVQRLRRATKLQRVVVATSTLPADQAIVERCAHQGYDCVRGSHDDVLSRFMHAAESFPADQFVRITADCPLIDPAIVDQAVDRIESEPSLDYVCNFFPKRTFPRGLDVEVFTRAALVRVNRLAQTTRYREHVTLYIYENPRAFELGSVTAPIDAADLRWTVDEPSDLSLIREIYRAFTGNPGSYREILDAYTQFPHWRGMNATVLQKAA